MLLIFVLFVVGLLGLAGLILDLGLARVVQGRMEGAVEGAALEGLGWRDVPLTEAPAARELSRRERARALLLRAFDEDGLDLDGLATGSAPNSSIQLGIGPDYAASSTGGLAGGVITVGQAAVVPNVQLNVENLAVGDLVAGDYQLGVDPADCAAMLGVPPGFLENQAYERCDFVSTEAVGNPELAQQHAAFLARLRRTSNPLGLDDVADASSSAPPLRYLLGRGALVHGAGGGDIDAGITLRGTAIADARPALVACVTDAGSGALASVSVEVDDDGDGVGDAVIQGVLALSQAAWTACFDASGPVDLRFEPGGQVVIDTGCAAGPVVGRVVVPGLVTPGMLALGEPALVDPVLGAGGDVTYVTVDIAELVALVAVYADVLPGSGLGERIIGFGAVELSAPTAAGDIALSRLEGPTGEGLVLPRGVTASFVPRRHLPFAPTTLSALLNASANLPFAVRAPVLVR
ncbi:MAG: hypothetical protein DHS20C15_04050 [Planctomycetota bacterium]|nr:MAG: hypothetical protein DHS20C15_04050 [Planctomycetota bacterium]